MCIANDTYRPTYASNICLGTLVPRQKLRIIVPKVLTYSATRKQQQLLQKVAWCSAAATCVIATVTIALLTRVNINL